MKDTGPSGDGVFTCEHKVGWGDCDPARIAYTSRLPDYGVRTIDAWWEHLLGYGWFEMNLEHGFGTPFVHLSCDFRAPVTPKHPLICQLKPVRLGNSSLEFDFAGYQNDVHCYDGRFISAFFDAATHKKIPAPAHVRALIEPLVAATGSVR